MSTINKNHKTTEDSNQQKDKSQIPDWNNFLESLIQFSSIDLIYSVASLEDYLSNKGHDTLNLPDFETLNPQDRFKEFAKISFPRFNIEQYTGFNKNNIILSAKIQENLRVSIEGEYSHVGAPLALSTILSIEWKGADLFPSLKFEKNSHFNNVESLTGLIKKSVFADRGYHAIEVVKPLIYLFNWEYKTQSLPFEGNFGLEHKIRNKYLTGTIIIPAKVNLEESNDHVKLKVVFSGQTWT